MIGKITSIYDNDVEIELTVNEEARKNLINFHVVFEQGNYKMIGEVSSVTKEKANILLIGEICDNIFLPGISKKPYYGSPCRYITSEELAIIIGNKVGSKIINIGRLPQYNGYRVNISIDSLFSNHFAILGNTGSGKSHALARLLQNLFTNKEHIPKKSNIFIFDAYGEYHNSLMFLNENPETNFKVYTTKVAQFEDANVELLKIPIWLLDVDDYALLLDAKEITQLPIIENALKLVSVFARKEEEVITYKNDIIGRSILEILYGGGTSMQIRDQIFAILTSFNTKDLNLESKIVVPGWTRTLRQCLNIDRDGKIQEMQLVVDFFKSYIKDGLELSLPDGTYPYTLDDLKEAFDFALISEGMLKNNKVYEDANVLRVRLRSLITSTAKAFFTYENFITKEQFIKKLITTNKGERAQIINFNINYVDDRFAKTIVKLMSKMLFEYSISLEQRASFPVHVVLEEAHRYVQNDNDINVLGYNIFERIAKEGRKYGVVLAMISQRPSEISETSISQCTNFLMFRMQHPKDLSYIKEMIPNISEEIMNKFKILQPGSCMAFGSAFKMPLLLKMDMPNPAPYSQNADINKCWY